MRNPGSVLCVCVAIFPAAAQGAVVQMEMTGTITTVQDSLGLLPFAHVGDQVVYRFSYDSEAPDTNGTPTLAFYTGIAASLRSGAQNLVVNDAPFIEIQHPNDLFEVSSHLSNNGLSPDLRLGYTYFRLSDEDESNALTSTDLPLAPYDLTAFSDPMFSVSFLGPGTGNPPILSFSGVVDTFSLIPEPTSLLLLTLLLGPLRRERITADDLTR